MMVAAKTNTQAAKSNPDKNGSKAPFFAKNGQDAQLEQSTVQEEPSFFPSTTPNLQAKCKQCEQEEKIPPKKDFPSLQAKLTIGQPGDKYEQEADAMSEKVVQRATSKKEEDIQKMTAPEDEKVQKQDATEPEEEDKISRLPEKEDELQTMEAPEEEKLQKKAAIEEEEFPPVMTKSGNGQKEASPGLQSRLNATKGSGSSLPDATRSSMEGAFGADFSQVRVHTNSTAVQMNQDLGAQAFTHGSDIYFNAGKYNPGSGDGQKLLAHELTHTVQQGGSNKISTKKTPDIQLSPNREFIPEIRKDPDMTFTFIGSELEQKMEVTNANQAPRGTSFHWGGGLTEMERLKLLRMEDRRRGRATYMKAEAMAPGDTALRGNLQYQVPGGPEIIHEPTDAEVFIGTPSVEEISYFKTLPDGNLSDDVDKMYEGETLYVDVQLQNVDLSPGYAPKVIITTGVGALNSDVSPESQHGNIEPGNNLRLVYSPQQIGSSNLNVRILLGNTPMDQAITFTMPTINVVMTRERFLEKCGLVNTIIDLADRKARAWLSSIAVAYGRAWRIHTDTLRAQDASNRLVGDLILGAALAFIPGGIGGVLGGAMKAAGRSDFMIDGMKDLTKWGLREAGRAVGSLNPSSPLTVFPQDPLQWQNLTEVRITTELANATDMLSQWQRKAVDNDPNFYLNFDPVQAMESSLTIGGQPTSTLNPVDMDAYAIDFEKGFWREWIRLYAWTVFDYHTRAGHHRGVQENIGKDIRNRARALGLDISEFEAESRERSEREAREFNERNKPEWWRPIVSVH